MESNWAADSSHSLDSHFPCPSMAQTLTGYRPAQAALKFDPEMMTIKDPFYYCAHMLRIHTAEQSYTANHLQTHHIELALAFPQAFVHYHWSVKTFSGAASWAI